MAVRDALATLFGIMALTWPDITVLALALLFRAWALVDGVPLLINAFQQGEPTQAGETCVPWLLAGLLNRAALVDDQLDKLVHNVGGAPHRAST
ncbi:MAG TPA: DUF308 domain-containing protein [Mycobacteriales bacterium]|nr:DUF308 domain-containing protein [Mycobacteriales bacterium]